MAKKEFKTESKRLLELMIHSIYTNKEIFLRELISNASDATDKRYYQTLQSGGEALNRNDLPISIKIDKENRVLSIEDRGCGMTKEELEENLGTIAKSGSLDFKKDLETKEDIDIIGQFGVGFYSAFMIADRVEVLTKTAPGDAYEWISDGIDGYTIKKAVKEDVGTIITLTLKKDTEDDKYSSFLDEYKIRALVKKHSDYIRYPIQMEMEKTRNKEGEEGETETYFELETLNSMTPIWKKKKSEVSEEEYNTFYKDKFFDYADPAKVIYSSTEGAASYNALLFVPSQLPMNYYSKDYQKGLQLYASGVLIMEHCADLLPDYFGFVRGIVDSQDLSLNISREMLQQDRQLSFIEGRLEKKIQSELLLIQNDDRDKYTEIYKNFGQAIKYGIYESYGAKKDFLQDLILFESSTGKMVTLKEYKERMPEEQKYIYYASGADIAQTKNLPAAEAVREKGFELLYFTDQIDEFVVKVMRDYDDKEFRSITGGDLDLETEEEKKELEKQSEDSKPMLDFIKEALDDKVSAVEVSGRMKKHPVCLTTKGEITLEMERVLSSMPGGMSVKAERVLELNPEHPVFKKLEALYNSDKDKLKAYAGILYNQSLILEGLPIDDPVAFSEAVNSLMV